MLRKERARAINTDGICQFGYSPPCLLYILLIHLVFFHTIIVEQNPGLSHAEVEDPGIHVVFDLPVVE